MFVDFFAVWCGKCEMLKPELETIADEFKDQGVFMKVDVETNTEVADLYKVQCLPTLIYIRNGEFKDEMKGSKTEKFVAFVEEHINE